MPQTPVIYVGVFLSWKSRRKLLQQIPPGHARVVAHHITLGFKPKPEEIAVFPIGKKVRFEVLGFVADENAKAVVVRPKDTDDWKVLYSKNRIPHITLSLADGISPVYSNNLLGRDFVTRGILLEEPFFLQGRYGIFQDGKVRGFPCWKNWF